MAIPSGSGTEVLKRTTIHASSDATTAFRWDGTMASVGTSSYTVPANHIITVLSIIVNDQGNAIDNTSMYLYNGADNIYIVEGEEIPAYGTFIWNDKFILTGGDKLVVFGSAGTNHDYLCSYIDQDWT